MDAVVLLMYELEVRTQCRIAAQSFGDIEAAVAATGTTSDGTRLWASVQSFLAACANISKLFRPSEKRKDESEQDAERRKARGEALRSLFAISDDSPFHTRKLRNDFEHFDERLDKWAAQEAARQNDPFAKPVPILARVVLPRQAVASIPSQYHFGYFDPETFEVTFLGVPYDLRNTMAAVQALSAKVDEEVSKPLPD